MGQMTRLYLAWSACGEVQRTFKQNSKDVHLNFLVAFPYVKPYKSKLNTYNNVHVGHTMLDSGAFSAWKSGKTIDIEALIDEACSGEWEEIVALDVIGNPDASYLNSVKMKAVIPDVIPVFHYGEPWDLLRTYCAEFCKVGLSCRVGETVTESCGWVMQCFAREWPFRFHSFGWTGRILVEVPFHSADCSSWATAPSCFGVWKRFGRVSVPSSRVNLMSNVQEFLEMEKKSESIWQTHLSKL